MLVKEIKKCRYCKHALDWAIKVIDLGDIYVSNFVDEDNQHIKAPLKMVECERCGLIQLAHSVDRDLMYKQYWYKSGLNKSMVASLQNVVDEAMKRAPLYPGDIVVDIGANDGTMLSMFPDSVITVGFDPAVNLAEYAKETCTYFINDYFEAGKYPEGLPPANLVTSIAMFYDLEDPYDFALQVSNILAPGGVWVIQLTDLVSMLKTNAFDNICHEHLEYYSLHILEDMFNHLGMRIFDVTYNKVNGGSIRVYVSKQRIPERSVMEAKTKEWAYLDSNVLKQFPHKVDKIRGLVVDFIRANNDKTFYVMGASTKGNTLLQYFRLGPNDIKYALEINPEKYGKKTVGSNIPIIPECNVPSLAPYPDYVFVLPWHFIDSFIARNQQYLDWGGKFLVPMPNPAVISKEGDLVTWTYLAKV